jgi:uncharacterized protein (DUF1919 family)
MRQRLKKDEFSIISSNCIGGILTHDLGKRFNSPTVNLYFNAEDFIKFCEKLPFYLEQKLTYNKDLSFIKNYPVCFLYDIIIHFVHYDSFELCLQKWEERKKRLILNDIFIIMTDRNGCNESIISRLALLPYKKVFFSHKPLYEYDFTVYVPGFEKDGQVGELNKYADFKGNRYYEKYFNFIDWLNGDI